MIEVTIRKTDSDHNPVLARITIENLTQGDGETADYSIRFGVEKSDAVGLHQRAIYGFPRKRYNALALVRQALNTLEPEELILGGDLNEADPAPRRLNWRHFL